MDSLIPNALGSALANIVSRTCTHPLDLAKARLQAVFVSTDATSSSRRYRGTLDVLTKTVQTEGVLGLYRGYGAVVVGGTPGSILYFCSYEIAKTRLSEALECRGVTQADFLVHFTSGILAEAIACIIYVPVDVTKERMQVQIKNEDSKRIVGFSYRNSWDALKQISRTEGLSGIYKGYAATLGSFGPFSAFYFMFYERFKYWARLESTGRTGESMKDLDKVDLPFSWLVLCSSSAAGISAWVTSPLDLAKLRLQIQRGGAAVKSPLQSPVYKGVIDCLTKSFNADGFVGLFRGAGARVLFTVPATTITMTSYETCRSLIAKALPSSN